MANLTGDDFGGNVVLSRAGGATANLVGVTAAKTYTTQNITYVVGGKLFYKAAVTTQTAPTTDVVTTAAFKPIVANQGCTYVWTLDASGNFGLAQGPIPVSPTTTGTQTNLDASGNFTAPPQFPFLPDTLTAVSYFVVKAGSTYVTTGGFIPGVSDNWTGATGLTAAQVDVMALPAFPQVS